MLEITVFIGWSGLYLEAQDLPAADRPIRGVVLSGGKRPAFCVGFTAGYLL